jgi:deoxyribodipyrimidine photolyase-related protein
MGWREFIAGMYTATSSEILDYNYFHHKNKLPAFFRDGSKTRMNCVRHAIESIRKTGYVNHTARLMVLGNLALLIGVDPRALYEWSMEAFVDACEWAAAPNAICLSQFADGGRIAMKPYVSSASLINRTSDYCDSCYYDPGAKLSENACPFNYLYWNFMAGEKTYEIKSCRLTIPHRMLEKTKPSVRDAYERKTGEFIRSLENIRINH